MGNHQLQHIHRQCVQDGCCTVVTTDQLSHRCAELGWEQMVLLTRPVRQLRNNNPRSDILDASRNSTHLGTERHTADCALVIDQCHRAGSAGHIPQSHCAVGAAANERAAVW
jgi:hypothetical protein